jgi:hypothetical protein
MESERRHKKKPKDVEYALDLPKEKVAKNIRQVV